MSNFILSYRYRLMQALAIVKELLWPKQTQREHQELEQKL